MPRALAAAVPLVALAILSATTPARAEPASSEPPSPDVPLALMTGAGTALVSFAVGGMLMATGPDETTRNAGAFVTTGGLTLAPLFAHGVVSEWGRGLAFSALPAGGTAGMGLLVALEPDAVRGGQLGTNYAFISILLGTFVTSAVGVADVVMAPERARSTNHLKLTPLTGRGLVGLAVSGDL